MNKKRLLIPLPVIIAITVVVGGVGIAGALNGWFGGGASIPEDTMTRGLVGYWPFDEGSGRTAHDASDHANNGVASSTWAVGKVGGAVSFDGVDDYVEVADSDDWNFGANNWSVEAWINLNTTDGSAPYYYQGLDATNRVVFAYSYSAPATRELIFYSASGSTLAYYRYSWVPTVGTWYHILFKREGSDIRLFLNGQEKNWTVIENAIGSSSLPDLAAVLKMGNDPWSSMNGSLDEMRVYNRALSDAEIRYHYNRGGPVAHWRFDEGSGTITYDETNSNNDGTLTGGPTWVAGKYGSAVSFDGSDDYVDASGVASSSFFDGAFTISAWAKLDNWSANRNIWAAGRTVSFSEHSGLDFNNSAQKFYLRTTDDSGAQYNQVVSINTYTNDNSWHHFAAVIDADGHVNGFYIDGVNQGSSSGEVNSLSNINKFYIGQLPWTSANVNPWSGLIDDVRVYNYERTPDEIKLDYNAGFAAKFGYTNAGCQKDPASCMTAGLVGYWDMEEGAGTVIHDESNNNNNGAMFYMATGTPWVSGVVPLSGGKTGGSALSFDNTDDYVDLPSTVGVDTKGSFEMWFQSNTPNTPTDHLYVDTQSGSRDLKIFIANNSIVCAGYDNGSYQFALAASLPDTSWHHFICTFQDNEAKLYFDGVESASDSTVDMDAYTHNYTVLGWHPLDPTYWLDGKIDEFKIYSRALSAEEVRYHYNKGGPVAQWKMDEGGGRTVYDYTENNNDGTLILAGSATSSAWVSGKFGSALSFDGVDDYIQISHSSSTSIAGSLTIENWVKFNSLSSQEGTPIYISKGTFPNYNYKMNIGDGEKFEFVVGIDGAQRIATAPDSPVTGVWYHQVGTFDGCNVRLYIDGVLRASTYYCGTPAQNSSPLIIGKYYGGSGYELDGFLDDVRIYNYVRTPDEIRLDYNAGLAAKFGYTNAGCEKDPASCVTEGLVGYWDMEEETGGTVHDRSDNGNNGTTTAMTSPWSGGVVPISGGKSGGSALNFNGVAGYVDIRDAAPLQLERTDNFTLSAWIKAPTSIPSYAPIIQKAIGGAPYTGYWFRLYSTTGELSLQMYDAESQWIGRKSVATLNDNTWHYVSATYDGSSVSAGIKMYIDGVLASTNDDSGGSFDSSIKYPVSVRIGGQTVGGVFSGLIDEVRIYSRVLSAEEVRYHYNKGGPVAQWKMDEGEGRTVYDSTPNNNDGTLVLAGSATSSAWVSGKYGSALSFDGTNDYVTVADDDVFSFTDGAGNDRPFTLGAWLKLDDFSSDCGVINKYAGAHAEWHFNYYSVTNIIYFIVFKSDETAYLQKTAPFTSDNYSNKWVYLTATYDGSETTDGMKIYIDGVRADNASTVAGTYTGMTNGLGSLRIGNRQHGVALWCEGLIDDVRIYNYARTVEQVARDYNAGLSAHFK